MITIGILGVVIAMTLPAIIGSYKEKAATTQLKKTYSILSQAFNQIVSETGADPRGWGMGDMYDKNTHIIMANQFVPYLNIMYNCVGKDQEYTKKHCIANPDYSDPTYRAIVRLMDGTTLSFRNWFADCKGRYGNNKYLQNVCGTITVDINGQKNPNLLGNDMFIFYMTTYGIYPIGTEYETRLTFSDYCDKTKGWGTMYNSYYNGAGCTAWVIYNENQEYLKCTGLGWGGKKKCR